MRFIIFAILMAISYPALGWDGYDWENGSFVEIQKGNLVRPNKDIEIFDYKSGEFRDVEVQNIRRRGNNVEVEIFDYNKGEYRQLEMED